MKYHLELELEAGIKTGPQIPPARVSRSNVVICLPKPYLGSGKVLLQYATGFALSAFLYKSRQYSDAYVFRAAEIV